MRITIKPPSPAPSPPLPAGALVTLRVEAADPAPLLSGPPSVAYEGRYAADPAPAFLFPQKDPAPGVSMQTASASDFRTPVATPLQDHVDIPLTPGDVVTATLLAGGKAYTAALTAPPAPLHPNTTPAPVEMALVEGGAAPPTPPPPTPQPQPAPGLTITPDDPDDPDVLTLAPAPGNDNIVVVN